MTNGLKLGTGVATQATKGPSSLGESLDELSKEKSATTSEGSGKDEDTSSSTSTAQDSSAPPAKQVASADDGVVRFSSHPILKYKVGRFRFENGLLELRSKKDVEDFRAIRDSLPASEKIRVKELDVSAAEAQVRAVLENAPKASKRIGSETGDRQPNNQVGKGTLESDV